MVGRPYIIGLVVSLALAGVAVGEEGWPLFRGNAQLTGVAPPTLPEKLDLLWTFAAGEGIESTAAINAASRTVYVAALDSQLYALDLDSGALRWQYRAGDEIKSSPSLVDGIVYIGDESGLFHAVDAGTGERRWTFQAEAGITSSANYRDDRLFFGGYDQYLYCLAAADGTQLWRFETGGYIHGMPALIGDKVAVAGCDGFLRLLDITDGSEQTQIPLGAYVGSSAAVHKGWAYVGTFGNQILGIDLAQGQVGWTYQHPVRQFPFYASAAVTDQYLVIGGRDKLVHALHPQSGEPLWSFAAQARVDSSPVIVGERVFFGTDGGVLMALDLATGQEQWRFATGAAIAASPAVAAGRLVIGATDGQLYVFGEKREN